MQAKETAPAEWMASAVIAGRFSLLLVTSKISVSRIVMGIWSKAALLCLRLFIQREVWVYFGSIAAEKA